MTIRKKASSRSFARSRPIKAKESKFFKWNKELNIGHLLTVITIIGAFIGLYIQKENLDTKVKDLEAVVDELEKEKAQRELQGLQHEEKILNSFNYNLSYTVDQLRATEKLSNNEFIGVLSEFNYLINLLIRQGKIKEEEINILKLYKERNKLRMEILAHSSIYTDKTIEFEKKYEPKRENFKSHAEYLKASEKYIDTLNKNTDYLQNKLGNLLQAPKKELYEVETKLYDITKEISY